MGYGFAGDLNAIGVALGPLGGSCVAVVQPVVDLRVLMRRLRREHTLPKVGILHEPKEWFRKSPASV